MSNKPAATAAEEKLQELHEYVEGSLTEFWKRQGVTPVPVTPCKEGEQGFSWSEFINGLGRRARGTGDSNRG
jgi:hypothetical protein